MDTDKEKSTLIDKLFGVADLSTIVSELTGMDEKCWCCSCEMKSHVSRIKIMPYAAIFRILKGKDKDCFAFRQICRSCAYSYGRGVVECDGNIYI